MDNLMNKNLLLIATFLFSTISFADESKDTTPKTTFGFVLGLSFGGDTLADLTFEDGSSEKLTAGDSVFFGGSVINKLDTNTQLPVYTEIGLSYMTKSIDAENGSLSFTRIPLDFFINTKKDQLAFGAGITYHLSPEIEGDGILAGKAKYDNALGGTLKVSYTQSLNHGKGITWGLRYTSITYSGDGLFDQDGSNFALTMGTGF